MTRISLALAATLLAGTAMAQGTATTPGNTAPGATSNAPMPGVNPSTGVTPNTGLSSRNSGTAAASGDRNQTVTTTDANAPQPARGRNSFTQNEARRRLERNGFQGVSGLSKDNGGVWRGSATKDGQSVQVWLDYKGNAGQEGGAATNTGASSNPPGTAAGRTMDRTLGTNTTGTNPNGSSATSRSGTTQ